MLRVSLDAISIAHLPLLKSVVSGDDGDSAWITAPLLFVACSSMSPNSTCKYAIGCACPLALLMQQIVNTPFHLPGQQCPPLQCVLGRHSPVPQNAVTAAAGFDMFFLPICFECGNTDNPCRCKVIGPTLAFIFAILACIVCWPCACIIWCCDRKAANRLFEFPMMKGYNGIKNSIPV